MTTKTDHHGTTRPLTHGIARCVPWRIVGLDHGSPDQRTTSPFDHHQTSHLHYFCVSALQDEARLLVIAAKSAQSRGGSPAQLGVWHAVSGRAAGQIDRPAAELHRAYEALMRKILLTQEGRAAQRTARPRTPRN